MDASVGLVDQEYKNELNSSNDSDVCDSKLSVTHPAVLIYHASVLAIIVVSTVLTNSLVLLLVCKYKRLQVRAVIIVVSLTTADICLMFSYTLPSLVTVIAKEWLFTDTGCVVFGFLAYDFLSTRWLVMGVLCLDRFFTVRFPFKYPRHSKRILVALIITAWVLPLLISLPSLFLLGEGMLRDSGPTCLPSCTDNVCRLYYAVCTSSTFFIGGILPAFLYAWMYCQGRRKKAALQLGVMSANLAGSVAAPGKTRGSFSQYSMNARERRALGTFVLLLVTVLVTGIPSYILALVRSINMSLHCQLPLYIAFLITELLMSASTLNPLVVMRDKDFRYCIKKLFCDGKAFSKTRDSYVSRDFISSTANNLSHKTSEATIENGRARENSEITLENGREHDGVSNGALPVAGVCNGSNLNKDISMDSLSRT